jgi:hypothetical protein
MIRLEAILSPAHSMPTYRPPHTSKDSTAAMRIALGHPCRWAGCPRAAFCRRIIGNLGMPMSTSGTHRIIPVAPARLGRSWTSSADAARPEGVTIAKGYWVRSGPPWSSSRSSSPERTALPRDIATSSCLGPIWRDSPRRLFLQRVPPHYPRFSSGVIPRGRSHPVGGGGKHVHVDG